MKLSEVIPEFIAEADIQQVSKQKYEQRIIIFFRWIQSNNINPDDVTRAEIIKYKLYLQELGLSQFTKRNYFTAVRLFFRWASLKRYHDDIATGIKPVKCDAHGFNRLALTVDQVRELLDSIDRSNEKGSRDYAIIILLIETGLRREEALNIDIGDITQENSRTTIYIKGKGRQAKDQRIGLTEETHDVLSEYFGTRYSCHDSDPLFTSSFGKTKGQRLSPVSLSVMIKERFKEIGLESKYYTCHSLRHTTACLLLQSNNNLLDVQGQLRHKSLATTQLYTKMVADQSRLENMPGKDIRKLIFHQ